jgi:hypothetical protein
MKEGMDEERSWGDGKEERGQEWIRKIDGRMG